jgi:hypothetical protein
MGQDRNKNQVNGVAVALFVISAGTGFGLMMALRNPVPLLAGFLIGIYLLFSIKLADQWQKVAVLRLGRYIGLRGPGLFPRDSHRRSAQSIRRPEGSCGQRDG